jgi:hypothetical protein
VKKKNYLKVTIKRLEKQLNVTDKWESLLKVLSSQAWD